MPRHRAVERLRIALSMKTFVGTAPGDAADSAISWRSAEVGGPARADTSWDRGTKRHAQNRQVLFRAWLLCTP